MNKKRWLLPVTITMRSKISDDEREDFQQDWRLIEVSVWCFVNDCVVRGARQNWELLSMSLRAKQEFCYGKGVLMLASSLTS